MLRERERRAAEPKPAELPGREANETAGGGLSVRLVVSPRSALTRSSRQGRASRERELEAPSSPARRIRARPRSSSRIRAPGGSLRSQRRHDHPDIRDYPEHRADGNRHSRRPPLEADTIAGPEGLAFRIPRVSCGHEHVESMDRAKALAPRAPLTGQAPCPRCIARPRRAARTAAAGASSLQHPLISLASGRSVPRARGASAPRARPASPSARTFRPAPVPGRPPAR
jgi:hypothetical protein